MNREQDGLQRREGQHRVRSHRDQDVNIEQFLAGAQQVPGREGQLEAHGNRRQRKDGDAEILDGVVHGACQEHHGAHPGEQGDGVEEAEIDALGRQYLVIKEQRVEHHRGETDREYAALREHRRRQLAGQAHPQEHAGRGVERHGDQKCGHGSTGCRRLGGDM